jgi:hypothetical protein
MTPSTMWISLKIKTFVSRARALLNRAESKRIRQFVLEFAESASNGSSIDRYTKETLYDPQNELLESIRRRHKAVTSLNITDLRLLSRELAFIEAEATLRDGSTMMQYVVLTRSPLGIRRINFADGIRVDKVLADNQ